MGKIETGLRAVKPRVDLRLYRGLYSPFPAPPRRSGGTGRRAGFRSQWAQARGGSSPPFGISARFWRLVDVGGGCGGFTSTVLHHPRQPPPTTRRSIPRQAWVDVHRPRIDPAAQTSHLRETRRLQDL